MQSVEEGCRPRPGLILPLQIKGQEINPVPFFRALLVRECKCQCAPLMVVESNYGRQVLGHTLLFNQYRAADAIDVLDVDCCW
jgi:hypothetical protein